jgi:hypothetical protein
MDTSLSQPSTSTADNIGKFDPPWIARRTDTRPASTGQPSVNEMRSYFGQLGYRIGKDADDYLTIDRPETDWFISRQRFIGPRVLWRWWRCETWLAMNKAVVCRMLEAWYATGTPHERVEIEQWCKESCRTIHCQDYAFMARLMVHESLLPEDWPRLALELESSVLDPAESVEKRVLRFIEDHKLSDARRALGDVLAPAALSGATQRL